MTGYSLLTQNLVLWWDAWSSWLHGIPEQLEVSYLFLFICLHFEIAQGGPVEPSPVYSSHCLHQRGTLPKSGNWVLKLLFERKTDTALSHPLVHFLNAYNIQGWAKPQPGPGDSMQASHVGDRDLHASANDSNSGTTTAMCVLQALAEPPCHKCHKNWKVFNFSLFQQELQIHANKSQNRKPSDHNWSGT